MERKQTRAVDIGGVGIGGENPVRVQSMCNTDTRDVLSTVAQITRLAEAGCEIVRLAVPDDKAAAALAAIRASSPVPLIADIHFDHRLALAALEAGMDGLRINPGNIGDESKVDIVVRAALERRVPIRIGVNGGSLEKDLLHRHGGPTPQAMVESGLRHVAMLERRGFTDIKISLKTSSVLNTIAAYRLMAERVDYPLHIGITEAGTLVRGAVKSAVGLGILLWEGIGDTLRVSLTHDPVAEIGVAYEILRALGLRQRGPEIISCPTCGRTEINLITLAEQVEEALRGVEEVFTVAVMGCVVNGPGEAREADIGIAGGRGLGIIFRRGEVVRKVRGDANLLPEFMKEIEAFLRERRS
ncbi:MAG: flavodoxin-dependent (E)-4-hydroxy-3-methylbut-2-enyl-diphosphate synthase [Pseudodesulfovibrio sp.]|uniref:4-hydroxy-3-methylbut-2-en-1-yl diphosphate synthase (flavodoxin) n=1 Tax=Pseudodesulfovibrio aespoeensis (strain ATCC 700646 / DSM 10631 / Aspo-2) TaxID=643562 RepID=E6VTT6_PSEA9|nr:MULTISPECIES: flavodoxin-dependent (E)-4-hydroxy-3-methylbut-2-enyl-diphosphate synthase [Pseudodesulfovibrio]MBU4190995.1 flavodoxin-dependent (E)-4-hydroxy-3-methylbut-2-enyl-diphosphate synthase [Pseudomonadota bacterium]ADU63373.1 1-hydroxy-2-methyl-2-(E)-butenyl 4-diphosphate synthase [Pseudodesulfovibrio aespoeensis Aspo-2]MBU4245193.1 flavodoxin-dependent (E)-4-hydroxy-3-methylbut-2-enyl-diphosphate synthase [Pseudomonadota bacterium]MBU4379885.1 flavodoxin-dependent (E)-4-hydroxy-3-m